MARDRSAGDNRRQPARGASRARSGGSAGRSPIGERERAEAYARLSDDRLDGSGAATAPREDVHVRPSRSERHSGSRREGSRRRVPADPRTRDARHSAPRPVKAKRRGRWKQVLASVVLVIALLAVAGAAVGRYLLYHPEVEVAAGQPVHITVPQGATTAEIADMLAASGVVDSALMFRYQARQSGRDGDLKPGEYDLATGMPYDLILERLSAGPVIVTIDVPIPEGFTARQVAERFAARAGLSEDELLALMTQGAPQFVAEHPYLARAHNGSLEGFLFPATYTIEASSTPTQVVEKMLDEFDRRIGTVDLTYAASRNLDVFDVVTIASILEREAKLPAEFPLVSSVIYNRLAKPMRLQLCASVLYTMPEGTTSLTNDDLDEDSPYNTYIHDGLPIGPISNPGMAALTAAAAPAQTNYIYYVLTGADGSQTFTATYDEFLEAKRSSAAVRNN